jgi:Asp-tRNA(Asn)/Glu-tRNA(Gln) amidotransferase A subunit family amidase
MSNFKEYPQHDATSIAELVHKKEISTKEVLEAAIERADALNGKLNAIIDYFPDEAREQLDNIKGDETFAGAPILIKDLDTDVKGHATTHGARLFKNNIAKEDCELVKKYKQLGMPVLGKSNAPEFGLNASTEGSLYGPCRNPWNNNHSTGGSSGGSAAAVAAGIVPVGHATDGGGSIRIPASCCGLFGMKPSRGMLSFSPHGEGWAGLDHMHVVTRSVRDSAALLDETAGYLPGDFHSVTHDKTGNNFLNALNEAPGKLKIGFAKTSPSGTELHPDCIAAVEAAARLCEELGHTVEEATPDYSAMDLAYHSALIGINCARVEIKAYLIELGRELQQDDLEVATHGLLEVMQHASAADFATALKYINQASRQIAKFYEQYDLWLTPTLATPPPEIDYLFCTDPDDSMDFYERISSFTPFTGIANGAGLPAMSIPFDWNKDNLPIGIQFIGRTREEGKMFQLARQIEEVRPWANKYSELD